ncbi:hypothetical protein IM40_03660 [Candidatus Paracaedimonas acanthamoebae]|nr:hypothetical protein IM40_03660 [Candidatus Paracaedimonas acanthamoebae]
MKRSSVSLFTLMIGLGSFIDLHADALSSWKKLNVGNNPSPTANTRNEEKLKKEISQLKTEILKLHQALNGSSLQREVSGLQSSINKMGDNTPESEIVRLKTKIEALKKKNTELKKTMVPSQDPTTKAHISKLEAEIAKLRLQLAQGGKGALTVDPEAEKKVREEVTTYTHKLTSELNNKGGIIEVNTFKTLLEKIENTGSTQLLLDLENKILELTTKSPNAGRLEGINIILEKSDILKELHQRQAKAHYDSLADFGQQRLTELTTLLKSDPAYFKKSPLTILVFMNKNTLDFSVVQKAFSKLTSLFKKTSQSDIQAIYSYFHKIGIDPMRTSNSSALMQTISQMIDPQKKGTHELSENEFKKLVEVDRQSLVDLINNIADTQLKEELKKLVAVGSTLAVKAPKAALELDASPQALQYFNALKGLTFLDGQAVIAGANAIMKKLKTKPAASVQEKASAAIAGINEFLKSENKPALTAATEKTTRGAITSIKDKTPAPIAGPGVPPPPPGIGKAPVLGGGNVLEAKVYKIGDEIPLNPGIKGGKEFKDNILATIHGREIQIQAEINKNKNKAKDIQNKLKTKEKELEINDEIILASAYAALTSKDTKLMTMRKRIETIIQPGLKTAAVLVATIKEVYP